VLGGAPVGCGGGIGGGAPHGDACVGGASGPAGPGGVVDCGIGIVGAVDASSQGNG
jgi:hypothetical protein